MEESGLPTFKFLKCERPEGGLMELQFCGFLCRSPILQFPYCYWLLIYFITLCIRRSSIFISCMLNLWRSYTVVCCALRSYEDHRRGIVTLPIFVTVTVALFRAWPFTPVEFIKFYVPSFQACALTKFQLKWTYKVNFHITVGGLPHSLGISRSSLKPTLIQQHSVWLEDCNADILMW
jgi:hypothetical protein